MSSTISNPYTFNINNNCTFSATIEAESTLPDSETAIATLIASKTNVTYTATVVIPAGVQVVKWAIGSIDPSGEGTAGGFVSSSSGISWKDSVGAMTYDENANEQFTYVGVTPNKTYTFTYTGYNIYYALYYSSTINEIETEFADY